MTKPTLSKKQLIIAIIGGIVIFVVGFFVGDTYRVNKIKSAFSGLGSDSAELSKEKKIVEKKLAKLKKIMYI